MRQILSFLFLLTVLTPDLDAQKAPYLVEDLNKKDEGALVSQMTSYKGFGYFNARSGSSSQGIWSYNPEFRSLESITINDEIPFALSEDQLMIFGNNLENTEGLSLGSWSQDGVTIIKNFGEELPFDEHGSLSYSNNLQHGIGSNGMVFSILGHDWRNYLWISDGTKEGTKLLHTIAPTQYSLYNFVAVYEDHVFFSYGDELFYSDGTLEGTTSINQDSRWILFDNVIWDKSRTTYADGFFYYTFYDSEDQFDVYRYTVSSGDIIKLEGLDPVNAAGSYQSIKLFNFDNHAYAHFQNQIWRIVANGFETYYEFDEPYAEYLGQSEGKLVFGVKEFLPEMYVPTFLDGTDIQKVEFNGETLRLGFTSYFLQKDFIFATQDDDNNYDWYIVNGESLEVIKTDMPNGLRPFRSPIAVGDYYLFSIDHPEYGLELLSVNSLTGESVIENINTQPKESFPRNLVSYDDEIYFIADDEDGNGVFHVNESNEIDRVTEIDERYTFIENLGDTLVYTGSVANFGEKIFFRYAATADVILSKVLDGQARYLYSQNGNSNIYFITSNYGQSSSEINSLWHSDGSPEGTFLISELGEGLVLGTEHDYNLNAIWNSKYYFAYDGDKNFEPELWLTDNTSSGTRPFDLDFDNVASLNIINDRLFVVIKESNFLWKVFEILDQGHVEIAEFLGDLPTIFQRGGTIFIVAQESIFEYTTQISDTLFTFPSDHNLQPLAVVSDDAAIFHSRSNDTLYTWLSNKPSIIPELIDTLASVQGATNMRIYDNFYLSQVWIPTANSNATYSINLDDFESEVFNNSAITSDAVLLNNSVYYSDGELYAFDLPRPYLKLTNTGGERLTSSREEDLGKVEIGNVQEFSLAISNVGQEVLTITGVDILSLSNEAELNFESLGEVILQPGESVDINFTLSGQDKGTGHLEVAINSNSSSTVEVYNLMYTVTGILQNIEVQPIEEKVFGDTEFEVIASGGASGNPLIYESSNTEVFTVDQNIVSIENAGLANLIISQNGDDTYDSGYVEILIVVQQETQEVQLLTPDKVELGGGTLELEAVATSGLPVTFDLTPTDFAELDGNILVLKDIGNIEVLFKQEGNRNYLPSPNYVRFIEIVDIITGLSVLPNLKIYPNPADQELSIELPNHSMKSLKMIDLSGKIWHESRAQSSSATIDVKALPRGMYILQLETATGDQTARKVLIQR